MIDFSLKLFVLESKKKNTPRSTTKTEALIRFEGKFTEEQIDKELTYQYGEEIKPVDPVALAMYVIAAKQSNYSKEVAIYFATEKFSDKEMVKVTVDGIYGYVDLEVYVAAACMFLGKECVLEMAKDKFQSTHSQLTIEMVVNKIFKAKELMPKQ
jgi:hypothetical protein